MATKLTETRLRQIIRQEARRLSETSSYMVNSPMTGKPRRYERGDGGPYDDFAQHIDPAIAAAAKTFPRFLGTHLSNNAFRDGLEQELARVLDSQLGGGGAKKIDAFHVLFAAEQVLEVLSNR